MSARNDPSGRPAAATIADVARRAGVGRGTVSRVINDRPNVDPATRERVRAAIAALDYVPSPTARRLSLGRTQTIGVVVPYMTTPSVVERLRGIDAALVVAGYDMIVFNIETVERRDVVLRDVPRRERVDGLLIVSVRPNPAELARIAAAGLPVVLIDCEQAGVPSVVVDDVAGGRLATEHLIGLGHRRIAFLGDPPRLPLGFVASQRRLEGTIEALKAAGIALPPSRVASGEHGRDSAAALTRRLMAEAEPPTAIVCASDTQAVGAIEALRAAGRHVPGDVSIVGYDDVELAGYLDLTTIRQPLAETGRRAVERLLAAIDRSPAARSAEAAGPATGDESEILPVMLVVRGSTGPPPAGHAPRSPRIARSSEPS